MHKMSKLSSCTFVHLVHSLNRLGRVLETECARRADQVAGSEEGLKRVARRVARHAQFTSGGVGTGRAVDANVFDGSPEAFLKDMGVSQ